MIFLSLFALVSVALAEYQILGRAEEHNPVNVKLTKLLDVKVESKADSWKNDFSRFFQPQSDEISLGRKDEHNVQIPLKLSLGVEQSGVNEDYSQNFFSIFKKCKSLVGRSKTPICHLNPLPEYSDKYNAYPGSCREILDNVSNKTGIYTIKPRTSKKPFSVLCDMETKGGGWTYIQKRFDGSQEFYLGYKDYKFGFGDLNGEFWIGLENIHHMTGSEINELLIELTDRDKKTAYAQFKTFGIGPEKDGYILNVLTGYSGDAGDALSPHLNSKFSTFDVDQDENPGNCAVIHEGAWWYKSCHTSNLNGKHINVNLPATYNYHGVNWNGFRGHPYILAGSKMMIRAVEV
ncbi:microfibril-associated glycoprotein 4-like [Diabrotica virgifera virgifera]|uniref:Fibrinogen C-terminal domain-containing protein n=1 Tax=Diabrotica virgifera virgifera TaxID=50390 RepID=A0ABM5KSH5_DIAVI|nr:microfibril-associated glycoprotein 4-like [Diabrotica virgifera virgifera]